MFMFMIDVTCTCMCMFQEVDTGGSELSAHSLLNEVFQAQRCSLLVGKEEERRRGEERREV